MVLLLLALISLAFWHWHPACYSRYCNIGIPRFPACCFSARIQGGFHGEIDGLVCHKYYRFQPRHPRPDKAGRNFIDKLASSQQDAHQRHTTNPAPHAVFNKVALTLEKSRWTWWPTWWESPTNYCCWPVDRYRYCNSRARWFSRRTPNLPVPSRVRLEFQISVLTSARHSHLEMHRL